MKQKTIEEMKKSLGSGFTRDDVSRLFKNKEEEALRWLQDVLASGVIVKTLKGYRFNI